MEQQVEEICARLVEKRSLLDRYASATEEMKVSLASGDLGRTTLHVKERRGLIDKIVRIDEDIERLRRKRGVLRVDLPQEAKNLVGSHLHGIHESLRTITEADQGCLTLALEEFESRKSGLLKIRRAVGVAKGYGATGKAFPRFLDMKR